MLKILVRKRPRSFGRFAGIIREEFYIRNLFHGLENMTGVSIDQMQIKINQIFKLTHPFYLTRLRHNMQDKPLPSSEEISPQLQTQLQHSQFYVYKPHPPSKKKLKINTSRSRGELKLLKFIILNNGWTQVFKEGDIMWSGLAIPEEQLSLATEMKVNRIPAMPHICHKRTMGYILNKFREYWPQQFWFYPRTFLLPEDTEVLEKKIANNGGVYIAKPSAGCQGDGIALIKKLSEVPKIGAQQWIVQPYIDKPLLLKNKKFDLRLYVLVSSVDPYICYLNEEGLARFCAEDYQAPTKQNFSNPYIHLTNYSLNKNHQNYENGTTAFSKGGKRCLKVVWEELKENGINVELIRQKITDLTQKFLTGLYPFLKYYYKATFPKKNGKCFHVIGIDILIDEELTPWLLEANNNPSFNIDHEPHVKNSAEIKKELSPVDEYVKKIVVEDTLFLMKKSLEKQQDMEIGEMYYSFKKILDIESQQIKEMNIIENMLKIFHSLCSIRSKWILTASQFSKLSTFTGMTSEKITKNDYHLIFIKIMRDKFNHNQMAFQDFIDALEYLVREIIGFNTENKLSKMQDHLDFLVSQLPEEK